MQSAAQTLETAFPHPRLSNRLRESTAKAHEATESSGFIGTLFRGECLAECYVQYLWALKEVYAALEESLTRHQNSAHIAPIFFPELFRLTALTDDLNSWSKGTDPTPTPHVKAATLTYTDRIRELSATNPELLVAHAYVRYLGDLSGGQILGHVLRKNFPEVDAFYFYDFPNVQPGPMKALYRTRLDAIGELSEIESAKICKEACRAFELNGLLFRALGAR